MPRDYVICAMKIPYKHCGQVMIYHTQSFLILTLLDNHVFILPTMWLYEGTSQLNKMSILSNKESQIYHNKMFRKLMTSLIYQDLKK